MGKTCVIGEIGINHGGSLDVAKRLADIAQECGADVVKTQFQFGDALTLKCTEIISLYEHCATMGISFACTAFDVPSLKFLLENTRMAFVKIASCDALNNSLLGAAHASGLDVVQSIKAGVDTASLRPDWKYLHVVPEYPTPIKHCNLKRVAAPWCRGLSDHSGNPLIPALAVALGAKIIECHLKLSDDDSGPDMSSSLNPAQFKQMVEYVRTAESALGVQ